MGDKNKWRAELLPTRQRIGGVERRTQKETCAAVAAIFERQVEPWTNA